MFRYVYSFFLFAMLCTVVSAQQPSAAQFPNRWQFATVDSSYFIEENYSDIHWQSIQVPASWESQGFGQLDGIAWYRCTFEMTKINKNAKYYVFVGKIDDADETYLNGKKVGASGTFPPNPVSEWNTQRIYPVSGKILKKKNVLAVRVFDSGGPGGIQKGVFGIFTEAHAKKLLSEAGSGSKSFHTVTTANGLIATVFNAQTGTIDGAYPHIFKDIDERNSVRPFIENLFLGAEFVNCKAAYLGNTHIIKLSGKGATAFLFSPFSMNVPVLVVAIEGKSRMSSVLRQFADRNRKIIIDSLNLQSGKIHRQYFLLSFADSLRDNFSNVATLKNIILSQTDFITAERDWMRNVFSKAHIPKLGKTERALFEQCIAFLKMAQVSQNEVYPKGRGQIVASLPPGNWNITWLRDGCYSILALNRLGLFQESAALIRFFLNADAGYYKTFIYKDGKEHGIGQDYALSVCRYYGIGKEESDFNENGPNIEIDGFGLFLHVLADYIRCSGDFNIYDTNKKIVKTKIADVLLTLIDGNGLVRKESGPWERHLPGKQVAYTSICVARGLSDYAALIKSRSTGDSSKYEAGSSAILAAISKILVGEYGMVKGTAEAAKETDHEYFDAGSYELFNFFPELYRPIFASHHEKYKKSLRISESRGFRRVNNGDWYDRQEWVVLNCRIVNTLMRCGYQQEAKRIRDWVTKQSVRHNNQIAELYAEAGAGYEGAVPMIGFGAAAYILMHTDK